MARLSKSPFFICGIATMICTVNGLSASGGMPIFNNLTGSNIQSAPRNAQPIADNSQSDSTQYNPYAQDEENDLNDYQDTQIYYEGGYGAAGYGAAAAVGAGLNEANNRNDRAAAQAAARRNRASGERQAQSTHHNESLGEEGHHAEGFGGGEHRGGEGRSMGEHGRSMGGGRGGRR